MKIAWTRVALKQLEEIQDYIAQDSPNAAYHLVNALIERTDEVLGATPMAGRVGRARGTRELVFPDLPYIVAYRVQERVEVLAVMHAARDWPRTFE